MANIETQFLNKGKIPQYNNISDLNAKNVPKINNRRENKNTLKGNTKVVNSTHNKNQSNVFHIEEAIIENQKKNQHPLLSYKNILGANYPSVDIPKHAALPFSIPIMDEKYLVYTSGTRVIVEYVGDDGFVERGKDSTDGFYKTELDRFDVNSIGQFIIALDSPITALTPESINNMFCVGCDNGTAILYKAFKMGFDPLYQNESQNTSEDEIDRFGDISIIEIGYISIDKTQMRNITHLVLSEGGDFILVIGKSSVQTVAAKGNVLKLFSTSEFCSISIPPKNPRELVPVSLLSVIPTNMTGEDSNENDRIIQTCFIEGRMIPGEGSLPCIRFVTLSSNSIFLWRIKQQVDDEKRTPVYKLCCLHVSINRNIIGGYVKAALKAGTKLLRDNEQIRRGYNSGDETPDASLLEKEREDECHSNKDSMVTEKNMNKSLHFTCMHYTSEVGGTKRLLLVGTSFGAILSLDPGKMHLIPQTTGTVKLPMEIKKGGEVTEQIDSYSHSPCVLEVMLPFNVSDLDFDFGFPRVRGIGDVAFQNYINEQENNFEKEQESKDPILNSEKLVIDRRIITSLTYMSREGLIHQMRVWKSLETLNSNGLKSNNKNTSTRIREVVFEAQFEAPIVGITKCPKGVMSKWNKMKPKMYGIEGMDNVLEFETEKKNKFSENMFDNIIVTTSNGVVGLVNPVTGDYKTLLRTNVGWNTGVESTKISPIIAIDTDPVHLNYIATINSSNIIQVWNELKEEYEFSIGTQLLQDTRNYISQSIIYHPTNYALAVASNTCGDIVINKPGNPIVMNNKIFNIDIIDDANSNPGGVALSNNLRKRKDTNLLRTSQSATFAVALEFCNIPRRNILSISSSSASRAKDSAILYALMNDGLIAKLILSNSNREYTLVGTIQSDLFPSKKCFCVTRWVEEEEEEDKTDLIFGICGNYNEIGLVVSSINSNDYNLYSFKLAPANMSSIGFNKHSKILSTAILSVQVEENDEPDAFVIVCLVAYLILRDSPTSVPVYCDPGRYKREGYAVTVSVCMQRHVFTKEELKRTWTKSEEGANEVGNHLTENKSTELPLLSSLQVFVCEANQELYKAVGLVNAPKKVKPLFFLMNINTLPRPICARIGDLRLYAYLVFTPDSDAISVYYNTSTDSKSPSKQKRMVCPSHELHPICIRDTGMPPVEEMKIMNTSSCLSLKNSKQTKIEFINIQPFIVCCCHCSDIPECTSITMLEWNPLSQV